MLPASWLVHTASLERYTGSGVAGAAYAAAVDVACYFEGGDHLVEKPDGTEIGLEGKLWTNETDAPVGSRMTISGRTGYVLSALPYDDGGGLAHTEVVLSSVPTAGETRSAVVALSKPSTPVWSDVTEATSVTPPAPYASNLAARITSQISRSRDSDVDIAEETLTVAQYVVSVDHDVEPFEGDEVTVTSCPGDLALQGRTLQVQSVVRGSNRLERDLFCTLLGIPRP